MCKFLFTLVAGSLWIIPSIARQDTAINNYINRIMQRDHIPGAAVAVVKKGKPVFEGYYGLANMEDSIPVTNQSVFEIASISKQFTCAAILLLQQDGKLSVNDKVSKYLDSLPDAWSNITIRQLMNHTSGLRDDWEEGSGYFYENYTDEKMFAAQKKYPLRFAPGDQFNYSSGPFDLGLIIKKVTGQTYAQFMQQRVFKVLGMNATSIYDHYQVVPHRVAGYTWNDSLSVFQNGVDIPSASVARGDVGVITSIPDMIKWTVAITTNKLLNTESQREMFATSALNDGTPVNYGYGWGINFYYGQLTNSHSGGFRTGFASDLMIFPEDELAVMFFTNNWGGHFSSMRIASMADAGFGKHFASIQAILNQAVKDPDTVRTHKLSVWLEGFVNKKGTDVAGYKRIYWKGGNVVPEDMEGYNGLTYLGEQNLRLKPAMIFNEKISRVVYFGLKSKYVKYLAFNYNEAGKLVFVMDNT
ncbi:MAG: serine hydrolase domain-containing protein [Chitinophagaceae bacterium]